jgi:hypothetical protein
MRNPFIFQSIAAVITLLTLAGAVAFFLTSSTPAARTPIYQLSPAPTAGQLIGAVTANGRTKWGATSLAGATGQQFGVVDDTLSATGTYVVDVTVESATYEVFLQPVTSLGHNINVVSTSDTAFIVKAWVNDTAANANILKFNWQIKE